MTVRYLAPEWCVKSLFRKSGILCKGEQSSFPSQPFHTPQNHYHQPLFILEDATGRTVDEINIVAADDRQVSQSGKPLCTGASPWAVPKLARGLCPLEPRKRISSFTILSRCSCFCRFKMLTGHSETIETSQLGLCPAPTKGASLSLLESLASRKITG